MHPWSLASFCFILSCTAQVQPPRAVIVDGPGPWRDSRWTLGVTEFSSLLADAGYQVTTAAPTDLTAAVLTPDILLAVPSLESLPLASFKAIGAFTSAGGSLMASGGEPFRTPLYQAANGQWSDAASILQPLVPAKTVLDPTTATLFAISQLPATVTRTTVAGPDGVSKALDFQMQIPANQYYLLSAPLTKPVFIAGQTATIVSTRGTVGQSMLIEWDENDGSRWIAAIPLTTQWTKHILLPSDFHYQAGAPARAATSFNPAQASGIYFGVSTSLGASPGALEFALSAIGVATPPVLETFPVPVMETLSPSYKQYVTQRARQTVRVPFVRSRGLSATADPDGRYRAVGDPFNPSATWYLNTAGVLTIWVPWPQLQEPDRAQLAALLSAAPNRLYLLNAGPTQIVTLPVEDVMVGARVINASRGTAQANLLWTIADATGAIAAQSSAALTLAAGELQTAPAADLGQLPPGDYTVSASLALGTQEIDRIDSRVRVFDPAVTFQPDQRIVAANGAFATAAGTPVFLQGVNYWPRYTAALEPKRFVQSWLAPQNYDPDLVEADLALIDSLNFNLVSFQYTDPEQGRSLIDFLERCRNHGVWANIYISTFVRSAAGSGQILLSGAIFSVNPNIGALLQAASLPGHDRVFALDLLWEPGLGVHDSRVAFDSAWRAWVADQYGSVANAEKAWGFTGPRDAQGQLSNPLDTQVQTDGAWRVMVAAYRRFADDALGRSLGVATRAIRSAAPGTLLSFRNGLGSWTAFNNQMMGYDLGTGAAHVDFVSSEAYLLPPDWPAGRGYGFAPAYGRYRSAGKPFYWAEYGLDVGLNGAAASRAAQASYCDSMMRVANEDGSGAGAVWWLPGGLEVDTGVDYGILNPDSTPRDSASVLAKWGAQFAAAPPSQGAGALVTLTVDRDADARGQFGLFLRWQPDYVQAKQAGRPVAIRDDGTGTDTSTMPLMQVGNVPYAGTGPLKFANGEFAEIRVQCPGLDVTVENGTQVAAPAGTCQISPVLLNTGSATWKAGVVLHTSVGDSPLAGPLPYLQHASFGPLDVTVGQGTAVTGRLTIPGVGPFGESLHVTLISSGQ